MSASPNFDQASSISEANRKRKMSNFRASRFCDISKGCAGYFIYTAKTSLRRYDMNRLVRCFKKLLWTILFVLTLTSIADVYLEIVEQMAG